MRVKNRTFISLIAVLAITGCGGRSANTSDAEVSASDTDVESGFVTPSAAMPVEPRPWSSVETYPQGAIVFSIRNCTFR